MVVELRELGTKREPEGKPGGAVLLRCPSCRTELRLTDPSVREGPCPSCGHRVVVDDPRPLGPPLPTQHTYAVNIEGLLEERHRRALGNLKMTNQRALIWGEAKEFAASQAGRCVLALVFLATVVLLVFQFFRWDARRLEEVNERVFPSRGVGEEAGEGLEAAPSVWDPSVR